MTLAACFVYAPTRGDDEISISRQRLETLERRATDADRLEHELAQLRNELALLSGKPAAGSSRGSASAHADALSTLQQSPAASQSFASEPVTTPSGAVELPLIERDQEVIATDILSHYAADPASADARYRKKTLRLKGTVSDVDKELFLAPYVVIFKGTNTPVRIECSITPSANYGKVYLTRDRQRIIGEAGAGRRVLAEVGRETVIRARCQGLKEGVVRFSAIEP
jgi:hypothetical protein